MKYKIKKNNASMIKALKFLCASQFDKWGKDLTSEM